MRKKIEHSDQWRGGDSGFAPLGPVSAPGSQQRKSLCPPHQETDNTSFSLLEEVKPGPPSSKPNLDLNSPPNACKQQDAEMFQILLLVEPEKVQTLTCTQWHKSQRCTIRPDGYAIMEFRVHCLSAMKHWLKHHAPCVQIIRTVSSHRHFSDYD
jgi:hypothetical protein